MRKKFAEYVLSKNPNFLQEGAWSNEGLFWMEPDGKMHPLPTTMSHEEWANTKLDKSLEDLFAERWIRIQCVPNQYLFIDHRQRRVMSAQKNALLGFFFDQEMHSKYYAKGFVVERFRNDMEEFPADGAVRAYEFAVSGEKF